VCLIETVGSALEVPGKPLHRVEIASNGRRREVPALELLQHDAAAMGHKTPPVTRTLPRRSSEPHAQRPPRQPLGPNAAVFNKRLARTGELAPLTSHCGVRGWLAQRARTAAGLIDKSLLLRSETSAESRPRFQMLETVRAYAGLELTASGERDDALEGLARYCITEASLAANGLIGAAQAEWLDRVRDDLENYRGALAWLIERGRAGEASEIAWHLMWFWVIRGHNVEGLRWNDQPAISTQPVTDLLVAWNISGHWRFRGPQETHWREWGRLPLQRGRTPESARR